MPVPGQAPAPAAAQVATQAPATESKPAAPAAPAAPKAVEKAPAAAEGTPVTAPMPGMIVSYDKNVGDTVNEGDCVVVLEAMKMENNIPAPVSGTIKALNYSSGDSVEKDAVMCVIG